MRGCQDLAAGSHPHPDPDMENFPAKANPPLCQSWRAATPGRVSDILRCQPRPGGHQQHLVAPDGPGLAPSKGGPPPARMGYWASRCICPLSRPRSLTHQFLPPEQDGFGAGDGREQDTGAPVTSGRNAPPVLEAAEHDPDAVAALVAAPAVPDSFLSVLPAEDVFN